jgi:DNA-binding MarR family transcriptional regulator
MAKDEEDGPQGVMIVWPLERLARLMRAREHEGGLNPAQWEALRFLNRANRFSDSPTALTQYLGATKGTISQTLKALERKGYVSKAARTGSGKSVRLALTPKGLEALKRDPWADVAAQAEQLGGKTRRRMARGLNDLLQQALQQAGLKGFGSCSSCRFFRERGRDGDPHGPHLCMLFEQPLSPEDRVRICVEHEGAV